MGSIRDRLKEIADSGSTTPISAQKAYKPAGTMNPGRLYSGKKEEEDGLDTASARARQLVQARQAAMERANARAQEIREKRTVRDLGTGSAREERLQTSQQAAANALHTAQDSRARAGRTLEWASGAYRQMEDRKQKMTSLYDAYMKAPNDALYEEYQNQYGQYARARQAYEVYAKQYMQEAQRYGQAADNYRKVSTDRGGDAAKLAKYSSQLKSLEAQRATAGTFRESDAIARQMDALTQQIAQLKERKTAQTVDWAQKYAGQDFAQLTQAQSALKQQSRGTRKTEEERAAQQSELQWLNGAVDAQGMQLVGRYGTDGSWTPEAGPEDIDRLVKSLRAQMAGADGKKMQDLSAQVKWLEKYRRAGSGEGGLIDAMRTKLEAESSAIQQARVSGGNVQALEQARKATEKQLSNAWHSVYGDADGWKYAGTAAWRGLTEVANAGAQTANVLYRKFAKALYGDENAGMASGILQGFEEESNKALRSAEKEQEKAAMAMGQGEGWRTAGNYLTETAAALPDALLATAMAVTTGGASAAAQLGMQSEGVAQAVSGTVKSLAKDPFYWTSFAREFGPTYYEAVERGESEDTAMATATISALLNAVVEIGLDGASGTQGLPEKLIDGDENAIVEWVKSSLEEGEEEIVQGAISRLTQKAISNDITWSGDADSVANFGTAGQEFAGGFIVGLLLGGGQMGADAAYRGIAQKMDETRLGRNVNEMLKKAPDGGNAYRELYYIANNMPEGSTSRKAAQEYGAEGFANLSNGRMGKVYAELLRQDEQTIQTAMEKGAAQAAAERQSGAAAEQKKSASGMETQENVVQQYQKEEHHGKILDVIREGLPQIEEMAAVKQLSGNEFQKTEGDKRSLRAKVIDFFNSIGNKVFRPGMGDIELNTAGARDSLAHGYGKMKAATFAALPEVIEKGKIVYSDPNYKNRGYESLIISAPVEVGTETCYVGALIIRDDKTQRYKLHEVLMANENGAPLFQSESGESAGPLRNDAPSGEHLISPDTMIPQGESGDKGNYARAAEENTEVRAENARITEQSAPVDLIPDTQAARMTEKRGENMQRAAKLRQRVADAEAEIASPYELGVKNGETEAQNRVIPESIARRDAAMQEARKILKDAGYPDTGFVTGPIERYGGTDHFALTQSGKVLIQADSVWNTPQDIARAFIQENGKGEMKNGSEVYDGNEGRVSGERTGGETGQLAEGAGRKTGIRSAESGNGTGDSQTDAGDARTSARKLGIDNGADTGNLRIVQPAADGTYADANVQAAEDFLKKLGMQATFVKGKIFVRNPYTEKVQSVTGAVTAEGRIIIRTDAKVTALQLAKHEAFHTLVETNPGLRQQVLDELFAEHGEEKVLGLAQKYVEGYEGIYGAWETEPDAYIDEMLADAYAGINRTFARAAQYEKQVNGYVEREGLTQGEGGRGRFAIEENTGNDEKYLVALDDPDIEKRKKEISLDEAIEAVDNQTGLYYRAYASDNPMARGGYAMFAEDPYVGDTYGGDHPRMFSVAAEDLTPISEIRDSIIEARHNTDENAPWELEDFADVDDDEFADLFDPEYIVISADAYDNEDLVAWLWENVLEPRDIVGIETYDGAIVFDPDLIKRNLAAEVANTKLAPEEEERHKSRFSIDPGYTQDIEEWERAGRPDDETFTMGSTGDVLQGLGAIEQDIYLHSEKVNTILRQHPEMTLEEIKRIPEILEDPVLVLKSRNSEVRSQYGNSRLAIFGTVKATDGRPVMCILDLRPVENGFLIEDMQKVSSAYTKDVNPERFIRQSDVLYADKKRTTSLLRDTGFMRRVSLLRYGYVGSISYDGGSVNIEGVPFHELEQSGERTVAYKFSASETTEDPVPEYLHEMDAALRESSAVNYTPGTLETLLEKKGLTAEEIEASGIMDIAEDALHQTGRPVGTIDAEALKEYVRIKMNAYRKYTETGIHPATETEMRNAELKARRKLRSELLGLFPVQQQNRAEVSQALEDFANWYMSGGERIDKDALWSHTMALFDTLWKSAREMDESGTEVYGPAATMMKGMKLDVPESVRADFGDDWGDVRRALFGVGIYTTKKGGLPLDSAYAELSAVHPGFFDEHELDGKAQLEKILEIAQEARPRAMTLEETARRNGVDVNAMMSEYLMGTTVAVGDYMTALGNMRESWKTGVPTGMSIDDYLEYRDRSAREDAQARAKTIARENFRATPAMDRLGIRIDNSVTDYGQAMALKELNRARRQAEQKAQKEAERRGATRAERQAARAIARGDMRLTDYRFGGQLKQETVKALSELYAAVESFNADAIAAHKRGVKEQLREQMGKLIGKQLPRKKLGMAAMNYMTPKRIMAELFGDAGGKQVYDEVFRSVARNGGEMIRWVQGQKDKVKRFEGADGKARKLSAGESRIVQMMMEGRGARDSAAKLHEGVRDNILNAAADIYGKLRALNENKRSYKKAAQAAMDDARAEYGLNADELRLAYQASRMNEAETLVKELGLDAVKLQNAVNTYREMFDGYYDAINDFLVVHGYEPIGFVKGYTPHMQSEESLGALTKALQLLGGTEDVSSLPVDIAGLTQDFKPGKKYDPYFLQRTGVLSSYDIQAAFDSYLDYLGQVFFRTDDIMRVRALSSYIRENYAPESLRDILDWDASLGEMPAEVKRDWLEEQGAIARDSQMTDEEVNEKFDEYREQITEDAAKNSQYGNLVMWLDNYANILAGKQSAADRGNEQLLGRRTANIANKMTGMTGAALVGANMSSVLNQTSQLAFILGENRTSSVVKALGDMMTRRTRGWDVQSDFLAGKDGVDLLAKDAKGMLDESLFSILTLSDRLVATLAVRTRYIEEIRKGADAETAMNRADDWARDMMGSRMKGERPLAFESKRPLVRAVNMFQTEVLNSWEHVALDLPQEIRDIERTKGRRKAALAAANLIIKTLISAFVMNRLADELYGGTPAMFDVIGLSGLFVASGQGMTENDWIRRVIDNGLENLGAERIFGTARGEDKDFNWKAAREDTFYNITNDLPLVRNVAGLLGWGDETLPTMQLDELLDYVRDMIAGATAGNLRGVTDSAVGLLSNVIPGGRQLQKTYQGARIMAEGGRYKGKDDSLQLMYPVDATVTDWIKAILFGRAGVDAEGEYWASGEKALSTGQTELYREMVGKGADGQEVYSVILDWRAAANDKELNSAERGKREREALKQADLTDGEKLEMYRGLANADSRSEDFRKIMDTGVSFNRTMELYDAYKALYDREDMTAGEKATEFAVWLDGQDYDTAQKTEIRDVLKYYSMVPAEAGRYDKLTDAGLGIDAAERMTKALAALEPEEGKENVSVRQQYRSVLDSDLSDGDKAAAIGTLMDSTDEYTEKGELSQWGKFKKVLDSGLTLEDWYDMYTEEQLDNFCRYMDEGISGEAAMQTAEALDELKDQYEGTDENPKDIEKWRAIALQPYDEFTKSIVLEKMMDEDAYAKYRGARDAGMSTWQYVDFKDQVSYLEADKDANGKTIRNSLKNKVVKLIDSMDISGEAKDYLYLNIQKYAKSGLGSTPWH